MNSFPQVTASVQNGTDAPFLITGNTMIIFSINNAIEYVNGEDECVRAGVHYIGKEIPEEIFSDLIASLVADFVTKRCEHNHKGKLDAAYGLFDIKELLEKKLDEMISSATKEEK